MGCICSVCAQPGSDVEPLVNGKERNVSVRTDHPSYDSTEITPVTHGGSDELGPSQIYPAVISPEENFRTVLSDKTKGTTDGSLDKSSNQSGSGGEVAALAEPLEPTATVPLTTVAVSQAVTEVILEEGVTNANIDEEMDELAEQRNSINTKPMEGQGVSNEQAETDTVDSAPVEVPTDGLGMGNDKELPNLESTTESKTQEFLETADIISKDEELPDRDTQVDGSSTTPAEELLEVKSKETTIEESEVKAVEPSKAIGDDLVEETNAENLPATTDESFLVVTAEDISMEEKPNPVTETQPSNVTENIQSDTITTDGNQTVPN